MKISELQAVLTKAQQVAGDADVILRDVEHDAETVVKSLGLELGVKAGDGNAATVTVTHGPADPATPAAPADNPAGQGGQ